MRRVERSYTVKQKREAITLVDQVGLKAISLQLNIARGTIHGWTKQAVLSTAGMIRFMWKIHPDWMTSYLNRKEAGELALERMVQRIAIR
ncbi:hypothetical protein JG688_00011322 [Phytophthora aleatoria]|uniref:HTH psq-type domain-containing protein n=1 Tax=Phytophthora aleatoria TaxID=2496075 RepID=A0A8J5ID68_9STRA|nr:hypothetical protein JG688_00011322 [Phytophthora aleatoria]